MVGASGSDPAASVPPDRDPQEQIPAFRAEVHLGTVPVVVTDRDRMPIPGLTEDDFEIYEGGEKQQIAFLMTPEQARLELAIVIDASGSVERRVPDIRPLLADFLSALDPGDCVLMLPFSGGSVGPGYWNVDAESFALNLGFGGHTRLYDAINAALRGLDRQADDPLAVIPGGDCDAGRDGQGGRRKGAVLITDGIDTLSHASFGETLVNVWEARIPMIVLGIPTGRASWRMSLESQLRSLWYERSRWPGREELSELATVSGGSFIGADEGRHEQAFEEILTRLRSTYLIGYYLSDPPETALAAWRPIEVRVRDAAARATAPEGVYVSASRPSDAAHWGQDGRALFEAGDYERAMEFFERATAARWETPAAHYLRAVAALRIGDVEAAQNAVRWAAFFDPADEPLRAVRRDMAAASGEAPPRSEGSPIGTMWIATASHESLPLQQVGFHVARIVASHVLVGMDINIIRRPPGGAPGPGLEVWVREADDEKIEGEIVVVDESMEVVDEASFELTPAEARLEARDAPPSATPELAETIDELLESLRSRLR